MAKKHDLTFYNMRMIKIMTPIRYNLATENNYNEYIVI